MRYDTRYAKKRAVRLTAYTDREDPITLGIETSCDETAAAILRGGNELLSMSVDSQILLHREYGGVVPEIASRRHVLKIRDVVDEALKSASLTFADIDGIAVTSGPGLAGSLLVGLNYAKGMAFSMGVPFIGVNHIAGHVAANYLTHPSLKPPFVCLVASGGHSQVMLVRGYNSFETLGKTLDDAAGEALDKVARAMGLPYPGGPELERIAASGNDKAYEFSAPYNKRHAPDFSFSGIKTAVINLIHSENALEDEAKRADIAASFQSTVANTLVAKTLFAAENTDAMGIALAGGVSANRLLRARLEAACVENGFEFYCPDLRFCTDNGAMIACAGYHLLKDGTVSELDLNVDPAMKVVR